MQQREKHECSSSPLPIVVVHQTIPNAAIQHKGFYADNLAFSCEDDALLNTTRTASDVYGQLSQSLDQNDPPSRDEVDVNTRRLNKWLFWKAVLSGCMLAASIIIIYLWIHVHYVNPMLIEIFKESGPSQLPRINFIEFTKPDTSSNWKVEYDLPPGIPVLQLHAKDVTDLQAVKCPPSKFALALHLESNSELAEDWLKACGPNVAYFRIDGNPTQGDVERLIPYLKDAQYLPLKAMLKVEKGGDLTDNSDFLKTRMSDEVIKSVEISGYVTPQIIEELIDAVPYAEELTISGNEVCKSLRRTLRSSDNACKMTWQVLQKLRIFNTEECNGLYDLIYSCWNMPQIEMLQIRQSIISGPNSDYIKGILDRNRITRVDFADNSCFDETLQTYPFMCQPSK